MGKLCYELVEDIICDMEIVLAPELQPLSYIEFQTIDELMHHNFVPLSFWFISVFVNISEARTSKPIENHVASLKSLHNKLQQSSQFLQDLITDVLDDLCSQGPIPLASYEIKSSYDIDLIMQLTSWSCLAGASLQSSSENLQLNHKLYDDIDSICAIPNYDLEFDENFEHQEIVHVYHDPIAIYMEDFFT
jgi:hypothetical protein